MESIIADLRSWFLRREAALRIFAEHDSRVEGWFKGEMLLSMDWLRREHRIESFEREFTLGDKGWGKKNQRKVDFRVQIQGKHYLCELKAVCTSQAYGTGRDIDFYFRPHSKVGLWKDFRKLESLPREESPWIVSFIYPAPTRERWNQTLLKWQESIGEWKCVTSLQDYPDWLFVACWKLR